MSFHTHTYSSWAHTHTMLSHSEWDTDALISSCCFFLICLHVFVFPSLACLEFGLYCLAFLPVVCHWGHRSLQEVIVLSQLLFLLPPHLYCLLPHGDFMKSHACLLHNFSQPSSYTIVISSLHACLPFSCSQSCWHTGLLVELT